jgi:mRNA-degrading endonuclease toxin of MazEF toxin-antitoxin module
VPAAASIFPSSSDILAFLGILLFPARAACYKRAALATYRRIGGLIAIIPKDWKYLRGDIYYADMEPHIGSEQGGTRPVVVLQNDVGNRYAPTLIVATVTSRTEKKKYQPTHVLIAHNTAFEKPSVVQLEQIFTIDKSRIQRFLGQTTRHEMRRIEEALMNSLEINEWDRRNADE